MKKKHSLFNFTQQMYEILAKTSSQISNSLIFSSFLVIKTYTVDQIQLEAHNSKKNLKI